MKKIEIFQGCTNNNIRIDGIDFNDIPKEKIKDYLKNQIDNIDSEWTLSQLFEEFITDDFNYKLEEEYNEKCDQCGDYIWNRTYIKIDQNEK